MNIEETINTIKEGIDSDSGDLVTQRNAEVALSELVEQLEVLDEKPDQPLLNAARRLVKATNNAERNYALADLVMVLESNEVKTGNMGGLLHQEQADHIRRASNEAKSPE